MASTINLDARTGEMPGTPVRESQRGPQQFGRLAGWNLGPQT